MPSDQETGWDGLRERIIGLGESSIQKSYYPELQKRLNELERFRALLNESTDSIFLIKLPHGKIVDLNRSSYEQLGYTRSEILEMSFTDLMDIGGEFNLEKGLNKPKEALLIHKDGTKFPVEMGTNIVKFSDGKYSVIVVRDITDRKEAEVKIKTSLEEKNVLIKEIHHRVKNNMQVISSLLSLQSRYIDDEEAFDVFKESQNRVKSMAMIHEMLYQSPDLAHIDFGEYIQKMVSYLFYSYAVKPQNIKIKVQVKEIILGVDTAIPLGLIVNEIVTNSLKHAFPSGKGNISIELNRENNHHTLLVKDNGVGLPPNLNLDETPTLGLRLIKTLTDQLDGEIKVENDTGASFYINFQDTEDELSI